MIIESVSQFHVLFTYRGVNMISRGLLCDYEPSDGTSFEALVDRCRLVAGGGRAAINRVNNQEQTLVTT